MILLFSRSENGHRRSYLEFFMGLFEGRRASSSELWLARDPVFFLMIEEGFALFAALATFRAAIGRRTVGLLFRPLPALRGKGLRLAAKRTILGWLKRLPPVATLTILPFSVEPEFARIATGWIYDPQLWDLDEAQMAMGTAAPPVDSYLAPALGLAGGRKLIAALGRTDRSKGFDAFAQAYARSGTLRADTLFLSCGKIDREVADEAAQLIGAGGVLVDREISDQELLEAYAVADAVWCCYAPDYDQASGVMGRAAQLGVPVIVRAGSLIERFCIEEDVTHLAINPAQLDDLPIPGVRNSGRGSAMATKMAGHSLPVLAKALGVAAANA